MLLDSSDLSNLLVVRFVKFKSPMTTISSLESLARVDGEAAYLSRAVHRRILKWGLV